MGCLMIGWLVGLRLVGKWKPKLFWVSAMGPISACIIGEARGARALRPRALAGCLSRRAPPRGARSVGLTWGVRRGRVETCHTAGGQDTPANLATKPA